MSDRSVLYFELLEWLGVGYDARAFRYCRLTFSQTISNHEALASMMAMPIMAVASVKAVVTKKTKSNSHVRERTIVYEGSSSPRELLEGIAIQAQAALKGLESIKPVEETPEELTEEQKRMTLDPKGKAKEPTGVATSDENQKLLDFCRRILSTTNAIDRSLRENKGADFVQRLHSSLPKVFTSSSQNIPVNAGLTEESAKKAYIEWATRVRFEYCDLTIPDPPVKAGEDQQPHYKFYYNNEARMLTNSDIPKRSLAIAKEASQLQTILTEALRETSYSSPYLLQTCQ